MTEIVILQARPDKIAWVNGIYEKIDFKRSDYECEFIAIAEVNGDKAGVGRLQQIESEVGELGGMFVDEKFRGCGLASKIVGCLIENSAPYSTVYCLPFSHLEGFYRSFGFGSVVDTTLVPKGILAKHQWCNSTYDNEVLLLVLEKNEKTK